MRVNRDLDNERDRQTNANIIDMIDGLEMASLEERISFLYEVTGVILMHAIDIVEKDDRPSVGSKK